MFSGGAPGIIIAAGDRSGTTTFRIIGDTEEEEDETIKLVGAAYTGPGASSYTPLSGWTESPTLTLTIEDDDDSTITLTSDQPNDSIVEGNSGTKDVVLTVTLSKPALEKRCRLDP